jgi:hypothetical protein
VERGQSVMHMFCVGFGDGESGKSGCRAWELRVWKRGTWASCEDPRCQTLIFIFYFYFF